MIRNNNIDNLKYNQITTKEIKMPLIKGSKAKTRKGFSENVRIEMETGKPQKQAVAIAYAQKREAEGKKRKKKG